ncbi:MULTISPECIES: phosphoglycolate phosphatase [unclassified Polaromonas]|jgi:phosphoglycolate phosphatase|uniref:phosphoglycolate phosphatase n=1 Tax=unclassified Polaromonas TaxID=2638319 RepID=UPI0025E7D1E2|nr:MULTISPECIES: phosphoglycolate phosphatase [unclassified Polaromonas]HQS00462.1 phosphoglycolate phosphatase [Polaromonas sp.]HQS41659.1 phosphoglycolate phosphatase [Polaromonas sp.]HQS87021.1 phosphoglycolate phosphatase [Polaromonas sp.]HQT08117.1 phosphoglycolate phosphatase [Polaromonas sp.]
MIRNSITSHHSLFDAAIVDLDGTLVDTLGDFVVALNRMLADLSLPPVERSVVGARVGKGSEHLISSVLDHVLNRPAALDGRAQTAINNEAVKRLFPAAWTSYQRHYLAINGQHASVYPGVEEGLQLLQRQGLKLACLTNKPTAFAVPLLKAKGLDGFFSLVFGGDSFERKKPDPLPLRKTCEALGSAPARTLMIGDSSNDAQAARAAGCPVLLVTYGYNHGQPVRDVDADGFVDTLAAVDLAALKTKTGLAPR